MGTSRESWDETREGDVYTIQKERTEQCEPAKHPCNQWQYLGPDGAAIPFRRREGICPCTIKEGRHQCKYNVSEKNTTTG
jgi:hypothetical protein